MRGPRTRREDGRAVGEGGEGRGHAGDGVGGVGQRRVQDSGALVLERRAHAQVEGRDVRQGAERRLDEAEAPVAHIAWELRQARRQQGLEETKPVEGDKAERHGDEPVLPFARQAPRAVGDPGEGAQQGDLVGGGLGVVQDDVAQQGQGARAVVGEAKDDVRPGDPIAPREVGAVAHRLDEGAVGAGQRLRSRPG